MCRIILIGGVSITGAVVCVHYWLILRNKCVKLTDITKKRKKVNLSNPKFDQIYIYIYIKRNKVHKKPLEQKKSWNKKEKKITVV